jgi:copper chaperone
MMQIPLDLAMASRFIMPPFTTLYGAPTMQYQFNVQGMTCGHCERAVTNAIQELDPQAQVLIDRAQNRVDVDSTQPREALVNAIQEEGYKVAA